jgi:hypothetical protein
LLLEKPYRESDVARMLRAAIAADKSDSKAGFYTSDDPA